MPNGAAFDEAVRIAKDTPGLGVGIHISLVDEPCVADTSALGGLVDHDGMLPHSYRHYVGAFLRKRFGAREVRAEVEAQVRRVLDAGIRPTHIDSHQHLHMLDPLFGIVLDVAAASAIPVVRVPLEAGGFRLSPRWAQERILAAICRRRARTLRSASIHFADHFHGLSVSGMMDEANLLHALRSLGDGVNEVMCHPGFSDPAMRERYQWGYRWDDEAAALQSEVVKRFVAEHGIRLASFADAWAT